MLEDRGVNPIDLASLPVTWPAETRHQRALEWFLCSLEAAEPYRETAWPVPDHHVPLRPDYLPAIPVHTSGFPLQEKLAPQHPPNVDDLRGTIKIWCHNRKLYPSWIVGICLQGNRIMISLYLRR